MGENCALSQQDAFGSGRAAPILSGLGSEVNHGKVLPSFRTS